MFWPRLISSLVGIPVLVAVVWYGGLVLLATTAILMFLATREISLMFTQMKLQVPMTLALLGCATLLAVAYYYNEAFNGNAVVAIMVVNLLAMVLLYPRYTPLHVAATITSTFYIGLFVFLFLISTLEHGRDWLILLLVCTWSGDTMAYLVGRRWGQRKITPKVSPGKTLEGLWGGVLGSTAAALITIVFYDFMPLWPILFLGIMIGLTTLLGDLVASTFKRQAEVKDSGQLIPGHGGVLDRFDSLLFTAPLVYYFVGLINKVG